MLPGEPGAAPWLSRQAFDVTRTWRGRAGSWLLQWRCAEPAPFPLGKILAGVEFQRLAAALAANCGRLPSRSALAAAPRNALQGSGGGPHVRRGQGPRTHGPAHPSRLRGTRDPDEASLVLN